MTSQPPILLIPTPRFPRNLISNVTQSKHARLIEIGLSQRWKPMKLSQVEKRIQQTL